uniref:BED-type domain-containing protein n=1 Tax=Acrobeloides nanus TaxID=290746 RepID=A0A914E2T3_9BILA
MSLLENTHLTFEIQKSRFVEIKNRLKSVKMENSNDSDDTSELQIDDTNQDIIENPETQSMVSEDFIAKNPTILSLLQQATREESTQHAQSTSPVGTATLSIASDDDSKSVVMDLSTRKDDISGPPSTSSGADQNGNGGSISRSAGRKKTHPVWQFFKDLRDSGSVGSVICLHCDWKTDDRSPNNLRTHLKRSHDNEIYSQYLLAQAQTPTQPYVKRNRGMGSFLNSMAHLNGQNAASFNYGMQSLQDTIKQELIDLPNTLDPNVLNQQQVKDYDIYTD